MNILTFCTYIRKKGNHKVGERTSSSQFSTCHYFCVFIESLYFSSYALLYMYLFMLGNRGKQKYDVRDILGDNILRFKCKGQIRNPWKLTSVAWDSRGVTAVLSECHCYLSELLVS